MAVEAGDLAAAECGQDACFRVPAAVTVVTARFEMQGVSQQASARQVRVTDLGLYEADPARQHVQQRDSHRVGRACAVGTWGNSVSAWW